MKSLSFSDTATAAYAELVERYPDVALDELDGLLDDLERDAEKVRHTEYRVENTKPANAKAATRPVPGTGFICTVVYRVGRDVVDVLGVAINELPDAAAAIH